jgi:segregation and condensation protein B
VDAVRGVDSSYAVGSLLDKNLIEACGRMDAPGCPMLYVTTDKFLRVFGLNSLSELPETEALSIAAAQAEQVEMEIDSPAEEAAPEGEYTEVAEDDSRA